MLETLDYTIRIGSTPPFLYFDLYLHSAYAEHYVCSHYISDMHHVLTIYQICTLRSHYILDMHHVLTSYILDMHYVLTI